MGKHSADPRDNDRVKRELSDAVKKAREIKRQEQQQTEDNEK